MIISIPREHEARATMLPQSVKKLVALGNTVQIETSLTDLVADSEYEKAGAVVLSREELYKNADVLLRISPSSDEEIASMKRGAIHISFLDPYNNTDKLKTFLKAGVTAISMEMIPRTTIAQKMDALSSQASLAGYVAVVMAAERSKKILPMMTTPAGTISPARVFIVGAGVAGLQAIATARRLGARVEAFDTRPVVEEQVASLGAKFVKIDLGETGQTAGGYAKALTPEQIKLQQEGMKAVCAHSDIVITTAKLFGRKAPVIITEEMVKAMKPGSVIVDLAAGTGGNVEGTKVDEEVIINGVRIIGIDNLPAEAALDASAMYGSNLVNLISHFWNKESNVFDIEQEDEILTGCVITKGDEVIHADIKQRMEEK